MSNEVNPYASPKAEPAPPPRSPQPYVNPYSPTGVRPFSPADGSAKAALVLILVVMATEVGVIVFRYIDVQMVEQLMLGHQIDQGEAAANEARILLAERLGLLAMLIAAIPFIMWLFRSHRNLPALRAAPLTFSPGWTIAAWFIPLANLVVPYLVVQEVYRGSNPAGAGDRLDRLGSGSLLVMLWWFLWVAANVVSTVGVIMITSQGIGPPDMGARQPDLGVIQIGAWLLLASPALRFTAGLCIIQIMHGILRNQRERFAMTEESNIAAARAEGIQFSS
jgi:hypothetical protein